MEQLSHLEVQPSNNCERALISRGSVPRAQVIHGCCSLGKVPSVSVPDASKTDDKHRSVVAACTWNMRMHLGWELESGQCIWEKLQQPPTYWQGLETKLPPQKLLFGFSAENSTSTLKLALKMGRKN